MGNKSTDMGEEIIFRLKEIINRVSRIIEENENRPAQAQRKVFCMEREN